MDGRATGAVFAARCFVGPDLAAAVAELKVGPLERLGPAGVSHHHSSEHRAVYE